MTPIVKELNECLNSTASLPFLFVGSGFSRRYLGVPDWKGLMSQFAKEAHPEGSEYAYQLYKNKVDSDSLPQEELLPLIAKEVEKDYTKKFLQEDAFKELREQYSKEIEDDISCLKIGVADYFKQIEITYSLPHYQQEVEAIKKIKQKVSGVVTTNYDTFIEYVFDDFETYIGQEELLFRPIYGMAEIYKIHGCCTAPGSLVLTSDDYRIYNKKNAYLSAKLLTIFLEHPVIFIGYSLSDPNINKILNDIVQCLTAPQIKQLAKRLFFVLRASDTRPENVITREKEFNGKPFEVTEIIREDFSEIYNTIGKSKPKYKPKILRNLKKDIYELVTNNDPKGKLFVLDFEDTEQMEKVDYVIGVGARHHIGDEGYVSLESSAIFIDILSDQHNYDPDKIVHKALPNLLKMHSDSIPVYKYIIEVEGALPERVDNYVKRHSTFDSFLNKSIRNKGPISAHSIEEVRSGYQIEDENGATKCLEEVVRLPEEEMDAGELKQLLSDIHRFHPNIFSKEAKGHFKYLFRKLVKIYDWMRFGRSKK